MRTASIWAMQVHGQWVMDDYLTTLPDRLCAWENACGTVFCVQFLCCFSRSEYFGRQWRIVRYEGIIFFESQRKQDYSTVMNNSGYSDRQSRCGLRHTSEGLHEGTLRSFMDTFVDRLSVSAIVGQDYARIWLFIFVAGRRNSQVIKR